MLRLTRDKNVITHYFSFNKSYSQRRVIYYESMGTYLYEVYLNIDAKQLLIYLRSNSFNHKLSKQ